MTNNDSFLSSGKEVQSLISLITRKQFSPQREGARTTFPFERLTLFINRLEGTGISRNRLVVIG